MRIDCHVHTSRYSGCSSIEPEELCELALERGLDALVLTEHRVRWAQDELDELRRRFPTLTLYSGVEISLRENHDVVCIAPPELDRFPPYPDLAELMKFVAPARDKSFLFVAHAFRYESEITPELSLVLRAVDGIEMNSVNVIKRQLLRRGDRFLSSNHRLYETAQQRHGLTPLFNSDGHHPLAVGSISSEFPEPAPPDEAGLAELLKRSAAVERQDKKLLAAFMAHYSALF
jgi:hypothetical protein